VNFIKGLMVTEKLGAPICIKKDAGNAQVLRRGSGGGGVVKQVISCYFVQIGVHDK
jgi:hypothetical protein